MWQARRTPREAVERVEGGGRRDERQGGAWQTRRTPREAVERVEGVADATSTREGCGRRDERLGRP